MDIVKLPSELVEIQDNDKVKVKYCGNVIEVMYSEHTSKGGYITKVDKDHYIDNQTGELKQFDHNENRSQDLQNVAKSMQQGRDIINTNVVNCDNCLWVTLTYRENQRNTKKVLKDFENFNARLRSQFGKYEYITCLEPQQRGAWHLHCILIFDHKAPFIENKIIADAWKQGFVNINKLTSVDNVGAYLSAYLCDVEASEMSETDIKNIGKQHIIEKTIVDRTDGKEKTKRFVKGARLYLYPSGTHIFRWSKGIKKPTVEYSEYKKAKEKVSSAKLTYSKVVLLNDSDNEFNNTLKYEYYNSSIPKRN